MKIGELKRIIERYPNDTELYVLHKLRECGAGKLLNILDVIETINQDTNKSLLVIETEDVNK